MSDYRTEYCDTLDKLFSAQSLTIGLAITWFVLAIFSVQYTAEQERRAACLNRYVLNESDVGKWEPRKVWTHMLNVKAETADREMCFRVLKGHEFKPEKSK